MRRGFTRKTKLNMPTQKQKFELYQRLQNLGFTYDETQTLRRAEMTLRRWAEAECGDSNDYCSTSIERDEATGKPFRVVMYHDRKPSEAKRHPIADREAGALRRIGRVVGERNLRVRGSRLIPYHQSDPRGCALYLVPAGILEGDEIVNEASRQGCVITRHESPAYTRWVANGPGGQPSRYCYRVEGCTEDFYTHEAAAMRWFRLNGKTPPASRNLPIDSYYTRGVAVTC